MVNIFLPKRPAECRVLLSLEDYESLTETAYLLKSRNNAKRIFEAIAELESGGGTVRELIE